MKVLICTLGLDQHEVGALVVARALRDAGMEVVYAGRFQVPETIARTAVDEDVDVVGVSCHSWEYLEYVDDLLARLGAPDCRIPLVMGGSVLTKGDEERLLAKGVEAVFGPRSTIPEIVDRVAELGR